MCTQITHYTSVIIKSGVARTIYPGGANTFFVCQKVAATVTDVQDGT